MTRFIIKIFITACAAIIASYLLSGVYINNSITAIILALVLALLNGIVKPLLIILTIPLSILTLGLFLLVINIFIIMWAADIVPGFRVDSWWSALLFSLLLSFTTAVFESLIGSSKKKERS
ncbi:phage holin family protein [soil metagenome]